MVFDSSSAESSKRTSVYFNSDLWHSLTEMCSRKQRRENLCSAQNSQQHSDKQTVGLVLLHCLSEQCRYAAGGRLLRLLAVTATLCGL